MSTTIDHITATRELALAQLADLERQRRELAIDVVVGSVEAAGHLEGIDMQLGAVRAKLNLCDLAEQEHAEREQALAEAEAEAEQARLRGEVDRLQGELDAALRGLQRSAAATGRAAAQAVQLGAELTDAKAALGLSAGMPVAGLVSALVTVRTRDECPQLHYVHIPAATRAQLIEAYPIGEPAVAEPASVESSPPAGRACSICSHERRSELEAALAAGTPLREASEAFGVSKSALSRHRAHSG